MGKRMKKGVKIVGAANDSPASTALLRASKPVGAGDSSISRSNDRNPPIPTDDVGITSAGVYEDGCAPAGASLNLESRPLPAFDKKPQARSASAKDTAYQEQFDRAIAM